MPESFAFITRLVCSFFPTKPGRTAPRKRRVRTARLTVEPLETRLVPSTFTVNNTLDDGSSGSLRWAINQANSNPGPDTIIFDSSLFSSPRKITLTTALPALTDSALTTLQGPAFGMLAIDGAFEYQIFNIDSGPTPASVA